MPQSDQWITATKGRIATDGYSWMQAVHWAHEHADYTAPRPHGPQSINETTLVIAQELSRLNPCRPGVGYLTRITRLSERTIQYHLELLRGSGLLTYRSKGTRVPGEGGRASEYCLTIPPAFDEDVRARTGPSEQYIRSLRGIDPAGLPLMKRLAKKASRAIRRRPARHSASRPATPSCTPMQVGCSTSSPTGTSTPPSESKLASGKPPASAPKKSPTARKRRSLNAVGRRYQLAHELITQVPWLARANTQRIAWIVRHVADAGWTAAEVIAVVGQEAAAQRVHRPSGFLASRLRGATELYSTPEHRAAILTWWQDSRHAEQARHTEWDDQWHQPTSRAVARQVDDVFSHLTTRTPVPEDDHPAYQTGGDGLVDLQQLTRDQVIDLRAAAQKDPLLIRSTIATCGEPYARRLFSNHLVDQLLRLTGTGRLILHRGLA
ncbi:helix-turn-helix domain-containing protein [Streptomyces yaizuensis]|uniref:Helix-turn-helix transcriptional regulator n=1 Tax=Streptomyces yaizuensis TaxID=2989713 RepID=A0ABQ5P661_9ACTN|nr:helix-turn-helix domain-containing protein [Streptomyces sp. YSPA8]GLF98074.1 helix-turn-helix transcriptional regulator [Streptomyces sp. YSPA8]